MIHIDLFAGIGGFCLAAKQAGWRTLVTCEIAEFPRKVLQYHFPEAYHHDDIKTLDYGTIDNELSKRFGDNWRDEGIVLTGGFPCQPFSVAGKRKGTEDERHLWPEMLRAIREIRPRWVVGENVLGIVNWDGGLVFEQVHLDLEAAGYEVQSYVLPACGVDAPHKRYRTWFVAHSDGEGRQEDTQWRRCANSEDGEQSECLHNRETSPYRPNAGIKAMRERQDGVYAAGLATDTKGAGRAGRCCESDGEINNPSVGSDVLGGAAGLGRERITTDPDSFILDWRDGQGEGRRSEPSFGAETFDSAGFWDDFPTQSPVRTRNDGFPIPMDGITLSKWRQESIKALGNSVVPPLVLQFFKAINLYEQLN